MLTKDNYEKCLSLSIDAALQAGQKIMEYYTSEGFTVKVKSDNSPVTQADKASSKLIKDILSPSQLPILSEEEEFPTIEERNSWNYYWCIDPLDGTKEFIRKSEDFTVNIALMENDYPVLGVIYLPVHQTLYYGASRFGAWKVENIQNIDPLDITTKHEKLPKDTNKKDYIIMGSHSHMDNQTKEHIQEIINQKGIGKARMLIRGSSIKMCLVAEGSADYYPRMSHIMEWDLAAGHAICEAAGCTVSDWNGELLHYNQPDFFMPWFKMYR